MKYDVCYECGSTDEIKYFAGKQLCEKCLFWYDQEEGFSYSSDGDDEDDEDME